MEIKNKPSNYNEVNKIGNLTSKKATKPKLNKKFEVECEKELKFVEKSNHYRH